MQSQTICNHTSEIISLFGGIIGVIVGVFLQLIINNMGKLHISLEYFQDQKSNNSEYAYIAKLFVYNASLKQKCIRNARFVFKDCKKKVLCESKSNVGVCTFETVRANVENKKETNALTINSYAHSEFVFSDLLYKENCNKILAAKKIYFYYEDQRGATKKIKIILNFDFDNVPKCSGESFS